MNPFGCPDPWLPWVMGGLVGALLGLVAGYAFGAKGGRIRIERVSHHSQAGGD